TSGYPPLLLRLAAQRVERDLADATQLARSQRSEPDAGLVDERVTQRRARQHGARPRDVAETARQIHSWPEVVTVTGEHGPESDALAQRRHTGNGLRQIERRRGDCDRATDEHHRVADRLDDAGAVRDDGVVDL